MMHNNGHSRIRRAHALKAALLASALVAGLTAACDSDDSSSPPATPPLQQDGGVESGTQPREWWNLGFKDELYNEITLFYLGQTWHQAADVGEVLETAARVDELDPKSWTREWRKTAERLGLLAQESERNGHPLSASHAYLRSATYYRAALHHYDGPMTTEGAHEIRELAQREVDSFGKYLTLSKSPCEAVKIPYENTTLPGYFCKSSVATGRAPTLLYMQGRDGWAEDGRFIADEAMKRGYHVLMFDGPGQGQVVRLQGLPFRPDWDKVVTPVVDYAISRAEVDPAYVGLMSLSMGGFLGPRAATQEHRLRVLIPNPGVIDWSANMENALDPALLALVDTDEAAFNAKMDELMKRNPLLNWGIPDFMWHHGVDTPAKLIKDLRRYKMTPAEVGNITAHTLVVNAQAEGRGQAQELFDAIKSKKDYLLFTAAETAQFHDQPGAEAIATHRILEWLEGSFSKAP
ncbi:alpha/beta hydrolase [Pendulispora rubella]|uniref:Alpha/beta hydrolase n=1 Tax=Pendulispora rubella TaxID=2741070 RepID=A0ABZ2KW97_9BACT